VRAFIWTSLFLLGLSGVVLPAFYLYTASKLPRLESEYDLESLLRLSVEGERLSSRAGQNHREHRPVKFARPDFARLPRDLVALYISRAGCPTFFQTPREDGPRWGWRLVKSLMNSGMRGDGECERYVSMRLAVALGIKGNMERTVAANKVHAILQKDQLVAWDFATMYFERGVVGVEDAAWELYRKEVVEMTLAELAEFALALPIYGYYDDLKSCRNASLIKQNRDQLLKRLSAQSLVPADHAKAAGDAPVACLKVK
jgi:hypothetical protein